MRILLGLCICFFTALTAHADVYYVDLNLVTTEPNTGGQYIAGSTGAGGSQLIRGTQSPTYDLSSLGIPEGSTIIFGQLDLQPVAYEDQYGDVGWYLPNYSINSYQAYLLPGAGCTSHTYQCQLLPPPNNLVVELTTTYSPYLQFTYTPGGFTAVALDSAIASAVPEPSTWALLLIGFAGIGFAGYRRSESSKPVARRAMRSTFNKSAQIPIYPTVR
jgi:hypothetical protein